MRNKKFWLFAAALWTIFIVVLCLVSFNELPAVGVGNFDKYVHAAFHFTFTIFWYKYLRIEDGKVSNAQLLFRIVSASLILGILLEFAQSFTKTRSADVADVAANLIGALIAALLTLAYRRWIIKPQ